MIGSRVALLGLTLVIGLAAAPAGLQAGPQETQPLPLMTDAAAQDRGQTRTLLAQLRPHDTQALFPRVSNEVAMSAAISRASTPELEPVGQASLFGELPMMPAPYESVLIVLAAAIAGVIGLWLGHIAGFVRLFRDDEGWPRTRA